MKNNLVEDKSMDFAVKIVELYKMLCKENKEYVMSKQLLRCGTSIGANVSEAQFAQSRADFASKMSIALKESNEARYWLNLLYRTGYLQTAIYESILNDVTELIGILAAICKSTNQSSK